MVIKLQSVHHISTVSSFHHLPTIQLCSFVLQFILGHKNNFFANFWGFYFSRFCVRIRLDFTGRGFKYLCLLSREAACQGLPGFNRLLTLFNLSMMPSKNVDTHWTWFYAMDNLFLIWRLTMLSFWPYGNFIWFNLSFPRCQTVCSRSTYHVLSCF